MSKKVTKLLVSMHLFDPISASLDVTSLSRIKSRPIRFRRCRTCKKMEGTLPIRIQSQYTVSQYPFYFTGSHTMKSVYDIKEFDRYLFVFPAMISSEIILKRNRTMLMQNLMKVCSSSFPCECFHPSSFTKVGNKQSCILCRLDQTPLIYLKFSQLDPLSTLSESKRAPSYNSWRKGKRAPSYNSWRKGKRAPSSRQKYPELYKRAPSYNSWRKGGKRAPSYNSWRTGKRAPSYDSWRTGKKRVPSYSSWSAGKRVPSYNSWRKGKRSLNDNIKDEDKQDGLPTSMADKRVPTYNSWRKGKRGPAYNSWRKGKRFLNQLASNEPKDELSEEKKSVEDDVSAI